MNFNLSTLPSSRGARRGRKRVGRGIGSGRGKTSTRGHNGQRARGSVRPGFEGGQTPIHRRLPKRKGLSRTSMPVGMFRKRYAIVNVGQLEQFEAGTEISPEFLKEHRIIKKIGTWCADTGRGNTHQIIDDPGTPLQPVR